MRIPRSSRSAAVLAVGASALGVLVAAPAAAAPASDPTLREMSEAVDFEFGAAVDLGALGDAGYTASLADNVTVLSTRGELSFATTQPERGTFDFSAAEQVVDFAVEHGLSVRGNDLVAPDQLPPWITSGTWDAATLSELLDDHVTTVVAHFEERNPGVITSWDVAGRSLSPDGTLRQSVLTQVLGDSYFDVAFAAADAAAPDAVLFYDDYFDDVAVTQEAALAGQSLVPGANAMQSSCDQLPKCAGASTLISTLLDRDVPIDAVGFEAQLLSPEPLDFTAFSAWVTDLGLDWAITEFDVPLPATEIASPEMLAFQADTYRAALAACVDSAACNTFITSGTTDRLSLLPEETGGVYGSPLWLDVNDQPKPAYDAIHGLLHEQFDALPPPTTTATTDVTEPVASSATDAPAAADGGDGDDGDGGSIAVPIIVGATALLVVAALVAIVRRRRS